MRAFERLAILSVFLAALAGSPATAAPQDERLIDAAAARQTELVRSLVKEGVDVNTRRADGVTALLWAAHRNDLESVDLLLRAGATVNAADDHGVTPLMRACENAHEAIVERLLAAGANANAAQKNGLTPLMTAARTGSVAVVRALLARGASVNATTTQTQQTPLMWAVAERHQDVVRALVEAGVDVQPRSDKGFTPLLFAARNGDIEIAKVLLAAGASVNPARPDDAHPLAYAIVTGHDAFALFLLDQGADPNGAISGVSALHAAAGSVGMWLRDWTRQNGSGGMAGLDRGRRLVLVKALLARGANPNARAVNSFVANQGFLQNGAFDNYAVGTGDLGGATPLWIASYSANGGGVFDGIADRQIRVDSDGEIIRALLAAGADPRITTNDGSTPLLAAAGCGRFTYAPSKVRADRLPVAEEVVAILVEAGVDPNAVNEADFTALHCAAYGGLNEVVQYLVEHGSEINARDWRGRTPFRLAEGAKQSFQFQAWPETAALFRSLGADTGLGIPGTVHERLRVVAAP